MFFGFISSVLQIHKKWKKNMKIIIKVIFGSWKSRTNLTSNTRFHGALELFIITTTTILIFSFSLYTFLFVISCFLVSDIVIWTSLQANTKPYRSELDWTGLARVGWNIYGEYMCGQDIEPYKPISNKQTKRTVYKN